MNNIPLPQCIKHNLPKTYDEKTGVIYCEQCDKETREEARKLFSMTKAQYVIYKKIKEL